VDVRHFMCPSNTTWTAVKMDAPGQPVHEWCRDDLPRFFSNTMQYVFDICKDNVGECGEGMCNDDDAQKNIYESPSCRAEREVIADESDWKEK
jgi:hypothetical protein